MNKKCILIILLLISFITINNNTTFAQESNLVPPKTLQNLEGKDELVEYINRIASLRKNMGTVNINPSVTKENSSGIRNQINFYLSEISSIQNAIESFEKKYSGSQPDLLFAEQIQILLSSYKMSLNQQLTLVDGLINNAPDSSKLFYSDSLGYIYYYLALGDEMISYINTFYNL